jgi:hypothetical protein
VAGADTRRMKAVPGMLAVTLVVSAAVHADNKIPVVSARTYIAGSAAVTVTGAFEIRADIPINTKASMSDGEMTWLQYGDSGSAEPNMLLTVSPHEVGFGVAKGKSIATAGAADCTGDMVVTGVSIVGKYSCKGVSSFDQSTGRMGKVDIEIKLTAQS